MDLDDEELDRTQRRFCMFCGLTDFMEPEKIIFNYCPYCGRKINVEIKED